MQQDTSVTTVAHVIQLAVAPVFLLSAIAAMLSVMTNRLARIVDRARVLEEQALRSDGVPGPGIASELGALSRRATLISRSITLCTATALFVCAVIAVLFLGVSLNFNTSTVVVLLFITAMVAFFVGLLMFLQEIFVASATMRIGLQQVAAPKPPAS